MSQRYLSDLNDPARVLSPAEQRLSRSGMLAIMNDPVRELYAACEADLQVSRYAVELEDAQGRLPHDKGYGEPVAEVVPIRRRRVDRQEEAA